MEVIRIDIHLEDCSLSLSLSLSFSLSLSLSLCHPSAYRRLGA